MMKKIVKLKTILAFILFGAASLIGIAYAQSNSGGNNGFNPIKVNKNLTPSQLWQGKISVRVVNMQSVDSINIIAKENAGEINVKIVSFGEREITQADNNKLKIPKDGAPISENSLFLSENEIYFNRPQTDGSVLLNIEIPEGSLSDIFYNNEHVVKNAAIYSSIAVRNGVVEKGSETLPKAMSGVMFPQATDYHPGDIVEIGSDKIFVPFTKLQLKESEKLPSDAPFRAILEINEQGLVDKIMTLDRGEFQTFEQTIRNWKFIPYVKDGSAVRVSTFYVQE